MLRKDFIRTALIACAALMTKPFGVREARAAGPVRAAKPAKTWEAVEFSFEKAGREFPGVAVRVPAAAGQPDDIYAVCRLCPHEACTFGYETNYLLVGRIVGKELANPVFLCRCHMSVYDPARGGEVVNGPAKRPPWRFEIRARDEEIEIVGLEDGAGEIK